MQDAFQLSGKEPQEKPLMKLCALTAILIFTFAAADLRAGELTASKFLSGQVTRDVEAALTRAKAAHKPVLLLAYDSDKKAETNAWGIGGTTGLPETKKLLAQKCIQVFAPWKAKGMEAYQAAASERGYPVLIFLSAEGTVVARLECTLNQPDALLAIRAILEKL